MIVHAAAMLPPHTLSLGAGARVIASRPQMRRPPLTAASQHGGSVFGKELSTELGHFVDGAVRMLDRSKGAATIVAAPTVANKYHAPPLTDEDEVDERDAAAYGRIARESESRPAATVASSRIANRKKAAAARAAATVTPSESSTSSMKRTRSKPTENSSDRRRPVKRRPVNSKAASRRQVGEIRSPTARTLLRMLRVGTGEATANDTNKSEAEAAITRLAGEFTPHDVLGKRYAGREALQVLLTSYLQKPVTFLQASECFHNPHNRGLEATEVFTKLLGDKSWPPYPENAIVPSEAADGGSIADGSSDRGVTDGYSSDCEAETVDEEAAERRWRRRAAKIVAEYREVVTTGVGPLNRCLMASTDSSPPSSNSNRSTTAANGNVACVAPAGEFGIADEFRPVITTGLMKFGTAFQVESDLADYKRNAGARHAMLELRSLQLMTHDLTAYPAALVTVKRKCSDVSYSRGSNCPNGTPISLTSLRCRGFLAQQTPVVARVSPTSKTPSVAFAEC